MDGDYVLILQFAEVIFGLIFWLFAKFLIKIGQFREIESESS